MPADIKTAPTHEKPASLEGQVLECHDDTSLNYALDQAFDYRGDVTIDLASNESIFGFISNRNPKTKRVEVFIKGQDQPRIFSYADIKKIAFTGTDTANGKSWQDWTAKKESERKAEAEKIKQELLEQGHL